MLNQQRYLASRFGIHTSAPFCERHTPWGSLEMDDQFVTHRTRSSSLAYLTVSLVSFTALGVLFVASFSPRSSAWSITKHGTFHRASITSLARAEKRPQPLHPCDCHIPNPEWVLERHIPVPPPSLRLLISGSNSPVAT